MFASLLEFFTQDWNISLKDLFAAEWGVFAALQFRLKAKPSDVAFHFKRLMKALGYDPRKYLGVSMYGQWQEALTEEELRRQEWESRVESRRQRKEKKKLEQLKWELEVANVRENSEKTCIDDRLMEDRQAERSDGEIHATDPDLLGEGIQPQMTTTRLRLGLGNILKNRLGSGITGQEKRSLSPKRMKTFAENNANVDSPFTVSKQKQRLPVLRPLSHSKSMLSMSTLENKNIEGRQLHSDSRLHRSTKSIKGKEL